MPRDQINQRGGGPGGNEDTLKEFEDHTKKWKDVQCSWIRSNTKAVYRFTVILVKILVVFFTEIKQKVLKLFGTTKYFEYPKQF